VTSRAWPKQRFSSRELLTLDSVSRFARAAGDENPLHHAADCAARTRFRGSIASGPHTSALLMGLAVGVRHDARLRGSVVELRGRLRNGAGETAAGAKGRVLLLDRT